MAHEEWLTVREVAALLKVHVETVRRWVRTGELRGTPFGGKTGYRVKARDVDAFLTAKEGIPEGKLAA
jgi:excisionase family DNA binding protein